MTVLQTSGPTNPLFHLIVVFVAIGIGWVIRKIARRRGVQKTSLARVGVGILVVLFVLLVGGSFLSLGEPVISGLFAIMVGIPLLVAIRAWVSRDDDRGGRAGTDSPRVDPERRAEATSFVENQQSDPSSRAETPIWRLSEIASIVRSGKFRLGGLIVAVSLTVVTFVAVVRDQATLQHLQTFVAAFVVSWVFFYFDLKNEYDDGSKIVGWALLGFLLFVVVVPVYTTLRVAKVIVGTSPDATPYFKASVGLALASVALVPVAGILPENETTAGVLGSLFLLALVLSGVAMFLDLNTDRHWSRAIVWPLAAIVIFYVVIPYYFYKRRRSLAPVGRDGTGQHPLIE